MSLGTTNRDGGKTSESGHLRAVYKNLIGEVLTGFNVSQRGAGANMSVDIAIGDAVLPRSDGTYGHPVFNDAILNKAITTADPTNPRRDIVIAYLDYTVTPSTAVSNNTNGVVLTKVVAGTPAGSPNDPNAAALQAAAGSGNPYIKLARVRVGAGVSTIANAVIDDLRKMAHGLLQGGWVYDPTYDWAYVSATSFKIVGADVRSQFPNGTKIALYQGGTLKWFVVTGAAFSTDTTVTINGMGVNTLANVPIDKPAYSYESRPAGFPVTAAYNNTKFRAYLSSAQTPIGGAVLNLDVEDYDDGNNFNTTTHRYVVPYDGTYHFDGAFRQFIGNGSQTQCALYKNGAVLQHGTGPIFNNSGGNQTMVTNASGDFKLVAGDYIELRADAATTAAAVTGDDSTFLSGHLKSLG